MDPDFSAGVFVDVVEDWLAPAIRRRLVREVRAIVRNEANSNGLGIR